jgi:DNA-binding response OmpR family regulator
MTSQKAPVIYIVDDEKVITETLAVILRHSGFAVAPFEDPLQALASVPKTPPDLLITDVMMPGMNGIDLAIEIRQSCPRCPVLLLSGKTVTPDLLEAARQPDGEFEIVPKPVHPAELLARIGAQLRTDAA